MTYADYYDAGLRDARHGKERAFARLKRRASASPQRKGYEDGYSDGLAQKETARQNPQPHNFSAGHGSHRPGTICIDCEYGS